MFGKNTPNDIFVDFDPESEPDDVCNAWTTKAALFAFGQHAVEFEQSRWLDDYPNRRYSLG